MSVAKQIEDYYKNYYSYTLNTYTRKCGSVWDAEDVVQDGFADALHYKDSYDPSRSFNNWISRIIFNRFLDWKAKNRLQGMTISYNEEFVDEERDAIVVDEKRSDLLMLVDSLAADEGERDKEVINLAFCCCYSNKDISRFMEINESNVRKIVQRFYTKMRAHAKEAQII